MLTLNAGPFDVIVENDPTFTPGLADHLQTHQHIHHLGSDSFTSSRHAVHVRDSTELISSCILTAEKGATNVHANTALTLGANCLVAVGSYVASLDIPSLNLSWATEVDQATCFGVYYSQEQNCLISHGELEIARMSLQGSIIWKASGADVFTNGFTLHEHTIETTDFNGRKYVLDISTGREAAA